MLAVVDRAWSSSSAWRCAGARYRRRAGGQPEHDRGHRDQPPPSPPCAGGREFVSWAAASACASRGSSEWRLGVCGTLRPRNSDPRASAVLGAGSAAGCRPPARRTAWRTWPRAGRRSPPGRAGRSARPLAEAERHRQHADDHRQRPSSAPAAGGSGRLPAAASSGRLALVPLLVGERDQQNAVRRRHADGHDRPHQRRHAERRLASGRASRRCPTNAPGSAVMMMNGSSQLWKFTTISR